MSDPTIGPGTGALHGGKWPWLGILLVTLVAPLFLRLWPIAHGEPRPSYVPDTHIVKNALNMANDKDLVPRAGKYSSYPYLLSYTLLPVYAAEYVRGRVVGDWSGAGEFGMELKENPWRAHYLARITVAVISASAAFFIFMAARAAGLGVGAWIAAWLAATCLLHVHLSTHERPWAPLAALLAATAWGAAAHVRTGSTRSLIGAGAAAAGAFCMNPAAGLALLMAGASWAVSPRPERDRAKSLGAAFGSRVLRGFACVGLFVALALLLGYPFYLRYGEGAVDKTNAEELITENMLILKMGGTMMKLGLSADVLKALTLKFIGYDPAIFFMGVLGLFGFLRRRALWPVAAFMLVWGVLFMAGVNEQIRYVLPMALLMVLPAGVFAERLWRWPVGRALVAVLMALPLVQALRLGHVLRQPDTRAVAEALLSELPKDALVAVDVYGPVPPQTLAALKVTQRLRERSGSELYGRETHRLMMLEANQEQPRGLPILPMENAFEYQLLTGETWLREPADAAAGAAMDLGETALSAFAAMGATHFLATDRSPDDGVPPPLFETRPEAGAQSDFRKLPPLDNLGAPVWTVHPGWTVASTPEDAADVPDAHLPTTLKFPLRDLWRVKRPGPKLELYALPIR
jgi:hypothetical protein